MNKQTEQLSQCQNDIKQENEPKTKMDTETIEQKIKNIVSDFKAEHKSAQKSHDREWVEECQARLSQMYYVCQELGVDYGEKVDFWQTFGNPQYPLDTPSEHYDPLNTSYLSFS